LGKDFFKENIDKVNKMDLPVIHANFLQISEKRNQIVRLENKALGALEETYGKMDEVRDDIKESSNQKGNFKKEGFKDRKN
jgi:hypothetical protein